MATIKNDTITFSGGRQIKVPGGILSISRTLELADYYSRNVLHYEPEHRKNKDIPPVINIYGLTKEELVEIADCMIQQWIELKDNVRKFGIKNPKIFKVRV